MKNLNLKTKFIIITAVVYLVVGVVTLGAFSSGASRIINGLALRFAIKQALLEKNKIASLIEREVVLAQKLADDTILRKWALAEDDPVLKKLALEQLESYRRLFRDRSYFVAIDASRRYYVFNRSEKGTEGLVTTVLDRDNPANAWYFNALAHVDTFALNLDYSAMIRKAKVWINAVMKDGDRKVGIGGSGIDLTEFLNEIVSSQEKGVSTILIDRRGVIQAHEDRKVVEYNAKAREGEKITIYTMTGSPAENKRLRTALETLESGKSEVEAFPLEIGGKHLIVAATFIRDFGWFNIVLVDVSHVLSARTFLPIVVVIVLSLLFVIVAITLLMNRMVLSPLTRLTSASREVAEGRYDIALPVTRNDEIGQLTGSFNAMTATVLDHTRNLENKVRERTAELTLANEKLEESQGRIMESLRYARVIQGSILPERELFERLFADSFVLYRPRDIVGGDLWWLREFDDGFLFAVIDCTGHGVPGAFMTMTVNSVLNHIVDMICSDDPARILKEMNRVLRETLHLREEGEWAVDAGLEIALCRVERSSNRLTFAGAGLSLLVVSRGELREIRGDRQRLGYRGSDLDYAYANHIVDGEAGTCFYATTDGLIDEGGGDKGYAFGNERLRAMLTEYAAVPLKEQGATFEQVLSDWRGDRAQRDDITMIGFRF